MASLRHVRRLHLADDVLPVAVDGVFAYFESGAYRLALQSLAHHVHDGYFAFAQQLLLVDVNLRSSPVSEFFIIASLLVFVAKLKRQMA